MATSMLSSATAVNRTTSAQASMVVAQFNGFNKPTSAFPATNKPFRSAGKAGIVRCMKVWTPIGNKKFETLSYLPPLTEVQLSKEIEYLIRSGWVPCLEFEIEHPDVYRAYHSSPGYYDGRYWTMWKLPMFGCTDSSQVLNEVEECKKTFPGAHIRIIGFDNHRQVQCISFIAHKP